MNLSRVVITLSLTLTACSTPKRVSPNDPILEHKLQVTKLDPGELSQRCVKRASTLLLAGDYESSVQEYTKAIEFDAKNVDAWISRAQAKMLLGDYQGAIIDSSEAEKYEQGPMIFIVKGTSYFGLENYVQAIKNYDRALSLDSTNGKVLANRGLCRSLLGNDKEAIDDYSQALARLIDPVDKAVVYRNRSISYLKLENKSAALLDYGMMKLVLKQHANEKESLSLEEQ